MPLLLERFGDANADVRAACDGAARAVMANLSSQGVKLVLPTLMDGAAARAWRTQAGSVQMLGAMAHCAPRQLSTALPSVVPRLAEALADPHPKVAAAARAALTEVGTVVRNAEVRSLAPALLAAIADPAKDGKKALDILLKTTFVNTVDAASLALVVPVLHRGLRDRGGDTKTRAARIVGSMAALIGEPKDLAPYVPLLLPEVETALVDPLPEVRATSARALGSLLRGMGEAHFADLLPRLLAGLTAEGASVERSGSAQGLAEELAVLGPAHVDALLPRVLAGCGSRSPDAREGSLALFRFLPTAMPQQFQAHLASILPAVLGGLADDADGVRDAALAAARTSVDLYADDALDLLLPAVEAGAAASSWRVSKVAVSVRSVLPSWRRTSSTVPAANKRPRFITHKDEHISASSLKMWELTKTVAPPSANLRRALRKSRRASGSRPLAGSSRMRTRGLCSKVLASTTRCICPRDNSLHQLCACSISATSSKHSATRPRRSLRAPSPYAAA